MQDNGKSIEMVRRKHKDDHDDDEIKLEEKKYILLTHTHGHHKFSDKEKLKMASFQSLDFPVMDNQILHEYNRKNTKLDFVIADIGKWIICFWIGVIIGVFAYAIKYAVDFLNEVKFHLAGKYVVHDPAIAFACFAGLNLAFAFAACVVILIFKQPLAGGSGIPEVKGYLNGVRIANSLNIKTLFGKLISLIFAFSSSLVLGPEGPMIHIGSMIGAALGQLKSKTLRLYPKIFWRYHNDRDRRDFISSGAAAGVAAAFGAPIGGTLFSIEEASSFWSQELTWRTFFTCLCATLTVSAFQNGMETIVKNHGMLFFGLSQSYLYRLPEIGAFAILGAIGGLFGAAFVYLNVKLNSFRARRLTNNFVRLIEVLVVSIVTSGLIFLLSMVFPCVNESDIIPSPIPLDCYTSTNATLIDFRCPEKQFSPMASLLFASPDAALRLLYTRDQDAFSLYALGVACVVFFVLAVLASGLLLAGGLFIPMMLVGATSGRFFGKLVALMFPSIYPSLDPSVYALVGTAAVMGGFSRMTISLAVIMVELTQGTQYLLPIILSVMISKWVGDVFTEAYYENMMELKCIPYLHSTPPQEMLFFSVAEIMRRDVVDFSTIEKVSDVVHNLKMYPHGAFPVVDRGPHNDSHYFRGTITKNQLLVLLKNKVFTSVSENDMNQQMTVPSRITYEDFTESLARLDFTVNDVEKELSSRDLELHMDLSPYINVSANVVHESCSYTEAYRLFRTMGLRHLIVVNVYNQVVGIITRKDLL